MNAYFFNTSQEEKDNILNLHKKPYDGLRTMGWEAKKEQPLYIQDFANDKGGITVNNKGNVKTYTNMRINEYVDIGLLTHDDPEMTEELDEKVMCEQCKEGYIMDGMCNECGYRMEEVTEELDEKMMCEQCNEGYIMDGICEQCGYQMEGIDDVEDLNMSDEFDYVGGATNATDTFENESVRKQRDKILEMFSRMNKRK